MNKSSSSAVQFRDSITRDGTLYVHGFHSSITLDGGRVHAVSEDQNGSIPIDRLGRVFLMGNCTVSPGAFAAFFDRNIPVLHLTAGGRLIGMSMSPANRRPGLRRAQYERTADRQWSLNFAQSLVQAKIVNQRVLLLRYRRRWQTDDVSRQLGFMRQHRRSIFTQTSLPALMGVEGAASRAYFSALKHLVDDSLGFTGRESRPPSDPLNSVLSFGYAMLCGEVIAALAAVGLDDACGVLHTPTDLKATLAFDLMEEFRPLVVDAMALAAFNQKRLTIEHFETPINGGEGSVWLTKEGRRRFFVEYERRMTTEVRHQFTGRQVTYREALTLQAKQLTEVMINPDQAFRPVGWS